ncbi:MAG TPA: UbiA family prenyltransferase, partial [Tepiditoga sp.]|nr:UbiA family prenyltransferase [Tepiditoga sp.]
LLIGIISFGVGISYSYGPIPISRTPLGEIFSAFFMGFVIVFLGIYINMPDYKIPELIYIGKNYNFYLNLTQTVKIFLLSFSNFAAIFNIMLSNNICDCEDDEKNKRYTLVYYIGKEYALKLYKMIYFMIYAVIIFLMISKVLPYTYIIIFFTLYGVLKNIKKFEKIQTKKDTFVLAVKNHFLINTVYLLILIFGILVPGI